MSPTISPRRFARPLHHSLFILALCAALVLAAAVSPGRAQAQTAHQTATGKQFAVTMLSLLNKQRGYHSLAPLRMNSDLVLSAHRHNEMMAKANVMSHQLPSEAFFGNRITRTGYIWYRAGENLAWNSLETASGVTFLERLMYHEVAPKNGHRLNILSKYFRNIGIDIYFDNVHHKMWITQDFGQH